MKITLTVNGRPVAQEASPRTHLADFLREELRLTGTHIGCEHGVCGACTVVVDGETARACITYAVACDGATIRTIEGFGDDPLMARLRQVFKEEHALQCGYCTPGMLIAARDLVRRTGGLSEAQIRHAMSGNLCRCTGYVGIIRAIQRVMTEREGLLAGIEPKSTHLGPLPAAVAATLTAATVTSGVASRPNAVRDRPAEPGRPGATLEGWDDTAATRIKESVRIAAPRVRVAAFMADIEQMAACLPGARLDGLPRGEHVSGSLQVKLGPIAVAFAGDGRLSRDPDGNAGVIEGAGRDGASRARGRIRYNLDEDGAAATRLNFDIAYSLTGPLAQFSRGDLVRDLVGQIARTFAQNIEARLHDPAAVAKPADLNAGSLMWRVVWRRIAGFLGLSRQDRMP